MIRPTPAIVSQSAVRRLPRLGLWLLCVAYALPGFVGREPWKASDVAAFGYMFEMARGGASWLAPTLVGRPPEVDALLPYWLGAAAIRITPDWIPDHFTARLPFVALLVLAFACTWWGVYHLARRREAQPVAFAFGGEALPTDYARALADAGLLALIACLGLLQPSHETTPALAQLGFAALTFYGLAALPAHPPWPQIGVAAGIAGLALSGAPTLAMLIAAGGAALVLLRGEEDSGRRARWLSAGFIIAVALAVAGLATQLDAWRWRLPDTLRMPDPRASLRLLVWFTWPAWPLALWTLWRWRRQLASRHVALPCWIVAVTLVAALSAPGADRALLMGMPAVAALAAFALPTFSRSASALIDWFTLLFFTGCAIVIWVVWLSLQTGVPAKPAANVARLAPGFEPTFSIVAFLAAAAGTLAWAALVRWRVGRHRSALWKSLVLPAGGATLCWLLMMTLWLPVLDYARSYLPSVTAVQRAMDQPGCVEIHGLATWQLAALRFHGRLDLRPSAAEPQCPWRILATDGPGAGAPGMDRWRLVATVRRPTDARDTLLLFKAR